MEAGDGTSMRGMKFRETRFDVGGRVVIAIIVIAVLVIIGAIIARLTRAHRFV